MNPIIINRVPHSGVAADPPRWIDCSCGEKVDCCAHESMSCNQQLLRCLTKDQGFFSVLMKTTVDERADHIFEVFPLLSGLEIILPQLYVLQTLGAFITPKYQAITWPSKVFLFCFFIQSFGCKYVAQGHSKWDHVSFELV